MAPLVPPPEESSTEEMSRTSGASSSSSTSSSAEFSFPMDRMLPDLFPYYAAAGGSVFPPPSCSLSANEEEVTLSTIDEHQHQQTPPTMNLDGCCAIHPEVQLREKGWFGRFKTVRHSCPKCEEWNALQMEKARIEVELLQQQLARYHPQEEAMAVPAEFRKTKDWYGSEEFAREEEEEEEHRAAYSPISDEEFKRQLKRLQKNPYPTRVLNICHQWRHQAERSQSFCHKVVLNEGIEALLDAMILQKDYPEVQEAVTRVLGVLVYHDTSHKDWLAESDGIAAILGAMKRFPHDADLQEAACGALQSFVYDHEPSQALVAQAGGVHLLLAAMKRHQSDPGVQELGCAALTNMACHSNVAILKSIVHCGGLERVVAAMKEHVTDEGVQEAGCAALSNLIYHDKALPADGIFATPQTYEIQAVIGAMSQHSSNAGIQEQACRAIQAMAFHHEANKIAMAECGASVAICQAMKQHSADALVLESALDALSLLSHNQDLNKSLISEADGMFAVLTAMTNHPSDMDLMESCCKCLNHLTACHHYNQQLLALSGGIPILLDLVGSTSSHAGIQKHGRSLLGTLLGLPETRLAFSNSHGIRTLLQDMAHPVPGQPRIPQETETVANPNHFKTSSIKTISETVSTGKYPEPPDQSAHGGLETKGVPLVIEVFHETLPNVPPPLCSSLIVA